MPAKPRLDSYDLEFLKQELLSAVSESQSARVLQKLDEIRDEMYLNRLETENPLDFGEPGEGGPADLGPFRINGDTGSSDSSGSSEDAERTIGEGYVQVGGFTVWVEGEEDMPSDPNEVVAVDVVVDPDSGDPSGSLVEFPTIQALQAAQDDLDHVYIPIYKFRWEGESGDRRRPVLEMDLRRMPMTGALETFLADDSGDSGDDSGGQT